MSDEDMGDSQTTKLPNGTEVITSDNTTLVKNIDGSTVLTKTDGTQIITQDGVIVETRPDGTKIVTSGEDLVETRPDGVRCITKSDGTTILEQPDGTQVHHDTRVLSQLVQEVIPPPSQATEAPAEEGSKSPRKESDFSLSPAAGVQALATTATNTTQSALDTIAGLEEVPVETKPSSSDLLDPAPLETQPSVPVRTTSQKRPATVPQADGPAEGALQKKSTLRVRNQTLNLPGNKTSQKAENSTARPRTFSLLTVKKQFCGEPTTIDLGDGTTIYLYGDKSTIVTRPDGSEVYTLPSGLKQVTRPDGVVVQIEPGGVETVIMDKEGRRTEKQVGPLSAEMDEDEPERPSSLSSSVVIKEGFLQKEGGSYKSWKKRYFQLNADAQLLYHDKPGGKFINSVDLSGAQVTLAARSSSVKRPFCFYVLAKPSSNKRSDSESERESWVSAIRQASDSRGSTCSLQMPPIVGPEAGPKSFTQKFMDQVANLTTNKLRQIVSKKKIRYQQDGYDLDLTYITNRVIAMGYPSEGTESVYRNRYDDVYRFFQEKHRGKYKIYNLCSERSYPPNKFHSRVAVFPFDDHTAPQFDTITDFCEDVEKWLARDEDNVIAVHCKAGKGRTGCLVSCFLLFSGLCGSAGEAIRLFGEIRTEDGEGVTIPSQRRYVKYFELHQINPRMPRALLLKSFYINIFPATDLNGNSDPYIHIISNNELVYKSEDHVAVTQIKGGNPYNLQIDEGVPVFGDVRIEVFDQDSLTQDDFVCYMCINTGFVVGNKLTLERTEVDKAHKPKHLKKFDPDFAVEIYFAPMEIPVIQEPEEA